MVLLFFTASGKRMRTSFIALLLFATRERIVGIQVLFWLPSAACIPWNNTKHPHNIKGATFRELSLRIISVQEGALAKARRSDGSRALRRWPRCLAWLSTILVIRRLHTPHRARDARSKRWLSRFGGLLSKNKQRFATGLKRGVARCDREFPRVFESTYV